MSAKPYCDVWGCEGADLRTAVKVCRDCLSAAEYARDRVSAERDELRAKLARIRDALVRFEGARNLSTNETEYETLVALRSAVEEP
jgi:hypothetical protein